jgi:tRNA pseudouridine55 synthase
MNGILNVDKPAGISSARAVAKVKHLLPRGTKVGHAGTLDPFATGVLLLLIGKATKSCEMLMDQAKGYEATIQFGATTETDDPASPATAVAGAQPVSREAIEKALEQFQGRITQRPPAYSALKVGGRRAYDLARRGQAVELAPRAVNVYSITLHEYAWPAARISVECGRGTYIRAIARDLGEHLGVGGYLSALRRTRIGRFAADEAVTLEGLTIETVAERLHDASEQSAAAGDDHM